MTVRQWASRLVSGGGTIPAMITSGVLLALVIFIGLLLWDAFVTQSNGALSVGGVAA